ncbi:hypothetical protein [Candidatus Entotheonella palauensis]|uniref:Uncharacterized protein n=1 Tax=Candidatus Entotheonella gemina TaxID=1429439 RepID=W4M992_9BACT|nr:hypothetical protein [Candidatus Entotheonella palauensis]ETX06929.1 MAG: hypothetical protein ETSY2_14125 [Candidatus Entotheonella gemina]
MLLRHVLAPGDNDPTTFKLDHYTTQRNLSDAGRQQVHDIGATFRQYPFTTDHAYTR